MLLARYLTGGIILLAAVLAVLVYTNPKPTLDVERIMQEGYKSLEDLPKEYLNLVPGIVHKTLYADNTGTVRDFDKKALRILLNRLGSEGIRDLKLYPWYCSIIDDDAFSTPIRRQALYRLIELAKHHEAYVLLEHYRKSTMEYIRLEVERCLLDMMEY